MRLAKSTMRERVGFCFRTSCLVFSFFITINSIAQDNSPYSRYGLGDLVQSSNVTARGMGGISAGYADYTSVNWNNPASYSSFLAQKEAKSSKLQSGRVVFDAAISASNRTLIAPNTPNRFTASDLIFSYLQVGIPLRRNWGLSFGIRPVSRISYLIDEKELLKDPITNDTIENAITEYKGTGGSYLPTIGTGFGFDISEKENTQRKKTGTVSFGINFGYLFGSRESTTLRNLYNDSALYAASDHTTNSSYGDIFMNPGLQYNFFKYDKIKKVTTGIRFGIAGNWKQNLAGTKDSLRQTYIKGNSGEIIRVDSVYQQNDIKGTVIYPSSFRAGFTFQHGKVEGSTWLFGIDYSQTKWSEYRYFGVKDAVKDSWIAQAGAQYTPRFKSNYFSRVTYRFGVSTGSDYVNVDDNLPVVGFTYGMGLPIGAYNRLSMYQYSVINLAIEYNKRGNNDNLLKENIVRISLGFSLSDLWFIKKKYE